MNDDQIPNQPPDPIDLEVGARLRDARRGRALSQVALGQRLKLTAHEIQRLENGLDRISATLLVRVAEAIGIRPAALLPEPPETGCAQASQDRAAEGEGSDEAQLLTAFHRIGSKDLQSSVVGMARRLADESELGATESTSEDQGEHGAPVTRDAGSSPA